MAGSSSARRHRLTAEGYESLPPDRQTAYVACWVYVFDVLTIAALVRVILSGAVLAFFGLHGGDHARASTTMTHVGGGLCGHGVNNLAEASRWLVPRARFGHR